MGTIVEDLPPPPEEETPGFEEVVTGNGHKLFPSSMEDDEALARRLQAEWNANDSTAPADDSNSAPPLPATPTPTPTAGPNTNHRGPSPESQTLATAGTGKPSVATLSNPWEFDVEQTRCTSCGDEFNPFNRRHHCRLCGKIFCNKCSDQRTLVPPSAIVLTPSKGGKKARPPLPETNSTDSVGGRTNNAVSFSPDPDPDRMMTYIDEDKQLLYGKGLEERFQLAREPLRVCAPCHEQLQPLQEELRTTNSNAMRFNHIDPTDPKRFLNSPLAFTLGHEVRKAAYTLNNMLPLPKRMGATMNFLDAGTPSLHSTGVNGLKDVDNFLTGEDLDIQQCKDECATVAPNFSNLDGVKIPARLLEEAKGVAVLTVAKGGFGLAGVEFGTGLVVARLGDNQQWSAPCAIGTAGMSWGALIGAQVSDHVFLLMTDAAVELMFNNDGNMQLGADVGVVRSSFFPSS